MCQERGARCESVCSVSVRSPSPADSARGSRREEASEPSSLETTRREIVAAEGAGSRNPLSLSLSLSLSHTHTHRQAPLPRRESRDAAVARRIRVDAEQNLPNSQVSSGVPFSANYGTFLPSGRFGYDGEVSIRLVDVSTAGSPEHSPSYLSARTLVDDPLSKHHHT